MKNALQFLCYVFIVANSLSALAKPASEIEGNTFAQRKINWVWTHRAQLMQSCLTDKKNCGRSDGLQPVLLKINAILKQNIQTQLIYISEKEQPDLFKSNDGEVHRLATTALKPGSPIYLNNDRISNMSFEQVVGILFHELTHHAGLVDDTLRVPDQIGARLAQHFKQQLNVTGLDLQKLPNLQSGVFQMFVPENLDGTNSFSNFGFVVDGEFFLGLDFNSFDNWPACDRNDAAVMGQHIESGLKWSKLADGSIHLTTPIKNFCVWVDVASKKAGSGIVPRGFRMSLRLDSKNQIDTSTVNTSLADNIDTFIDQATTLQIISATPDKKIYKASDVTTMIIQLKSFSSLNAKSCSGGYAPTDSPRQNVGWPIMEEFTACEIIKNEKDIWTVKITIQLSAYAKTGLHTIAVIRLSGETTQDVAFASLLKNEVVFEVAPNPISNNLMVLDYVKSDLKALTNLGSYPLTNSYVYMNDATWKLEVRVKSKLEINIRAVEAYFLVRDGDKLAGLTQSGGPKDLGHYLKNIEYRTSGDAQIARLTIQMPRNSNNMLVYGLMLKGLIIEDQSKNFLNFKTKSDYDYFFILETLANSPQN